MAGEVKAQEGTKKLLSLKLKPKRRTLLSDLNDAVAK